MVSVNVKLCAFRLLILDINKLSASRAGRFNLGEVPPVSTLSLSSAPPSPVTAYVSKKWQALMQSSILLSHQKVRVFSLKNYTAHIYLNKTVPGESFGAFTVVMFQV
jgi:hypothetical protein